MRRVILLSRRHPLVELALYSVIFINAWVHIVPFLLGIGYSSGTLTAIVIFLPLTAWVVHSCFGPGRLSHKAMTLLVLLGVIVHVILMTPIQLFVRGMIGSLALVAIQLVNDVLLFLLPWLAEKWRGGVLIRPVSQG